MRPSCGLCLILIATLFCLASCGREEGLVVTHDGRLVSATPEVAKDEFAHRIALRAADAAGKDWHATAMIDELPVFNLVQANEYGWKVMTLHLTLVPPRGVTPDASLRTAVEDEVMNVAHYRAERKADIHIQTVIQEAGAPMPGSQSYTTVAGDTWVGISTAFYGTNQHWRLIADANPGVDASPLPVGTVLVIPPKP